MSGFVCPECGKVSNIFSKGGGKKMAEDMGVPFLGEIPIDPDFVNLGDNGRPMISTGAAKSKTEEVFMQVVSPLLDLKDKE
jgi:ATP-binding protein involved in chromosome partitioning